nr:MAG TPA: transposase [Caudoviricetes sp.]
MEETITAIKLTTKEYADLRGCSERHVNRLCLSKKIDYLENTRKQRGGLSGISYLIPLASLPEKEIKRYLRKHKKEELLTPRTAKDNEDEVIDIDFERLSIEQREELNLKNKIINSWISYRQQEYKEGKSLAQADENFIRVISLQYPDIAISLRSIRRWDKIRRTKGENALVDKRGRHKNHNTKMRQEVFDIFEYYYLDESRKSITFCMELTKLELKNQGIDYELPSSKTFERWVAKISEPVVQYFRYGEKACKDKCLPYIHRDYEDIKSNDIWVCDNHTFDIFITKDEKPIRVYLTAFLDVKSRKIVGHFVTLNPSSDATLFALRRGIERFGIPKRILADNGREFLTYDIGGRGFRKKSKNTDLDPATIMERLGIDFRTALVRNARAKIIERTFLTVKNEFSKLFSAYTGGNVVEKPERLKYIVKDINKLTVFEDFENFVNQYIEGYYNHRSNTGIGMKGMTPNEAFNKYLVEQRKATSEVLNIMLLRSSRLQKVTRAGVKLDFYGRDVFFTSEELILKYQGEQVFVRYNPSDLKEVRIYDSEDRYILTAVQDKKLSYFASKEDIAVKMKEQRHYKNIVSAYKKEKGIKASSALNLILSAANENLEQKESIIPDFINIMRNPDTEFNELCIAQAVGESLDWSIANKKIKKFREN